VSGVLYIPFIHSRHNAKDRSLGVGRDIISEQCSYGCVCVFVQMLTIHSVILTKCRSAADGQI